MSHLIEKLKRDHLQLVALLRGAEDAGIGSSEGKQRLIDARAAFLAHLQEEDALLYPQLRRAAETDRVLKRSLDVLGKDMQHITQQAMTFFSRYEIGDPTRDFARDCGALLWLLKERMSREEQQLYAAFDRLTRAPAST